MTSERAFRGALLRVCRELGEETWTSFCFLWALPERVEEGGRSDVLRHLLQSGQLSCERPAEVAKLFRQELSRDDLAVRFEGEFADISTPGSLWRAVCLCVCER